MFSDSTTTSRQPIQILTTRPVCQSEVCIRRAHQRIPKNQQWFSVWLQRHQHVEEPNEVLCVAWMNCAEHCDLKQQEQDDVMSWDTGNSVAQAGFNLSLIILNKTLITAQTKQELKKKKKKDFPLTFSWLSVIREQPSGASGGSPVQEHELLLVGIPTKARAYLQSVVVIAVKPEATNGTNRVGSDRLRHTSWLWLVASVMVTKAHFFSASRKILTDSPLMSTTSRMTMMSYRDTICRGR